MPMLASCPRQGASPHGRGAAADSPPTGPSPYRKMSPRHRVRSVQIHSHRLEAIAASRRRVRRSDMLLDNEHPSECFLRARRSTFRAIATLMLTLLAGTAALRANDVPPEPRRLDDGTWEVDVLSPVYTVDREYRSMTGPWNTSSVQL